MRVIDEHGHSSVAQLIVYPGDTLPVPDIEEPSESLDWGVGQPIHFAGSAVDSNGPVPKARLFWRSRLYHCPGGPTSCHAHPLRIFPAVASGTLIAPDHDLPSHIEISLTATDTRGLSATKKVDLYPRVATSSMQSDPPGVTLSAGLETAQTPFAIEAIEASKVTISAPQSVNRNGTTYTWTRWSDGGARSHQVLAKGSTAYTAIYSAPGSGPALSIAAAEQSRAPKTTLGKHPSKSTRRSIAKFSFSADQPGSSFRCKLDRKPFKSCRSPQVYKRLKPGPHSFTVVATAAGVQGKAVKFSWKILPKKR